MEWNYEGFIDEHGQPVFITPTKETLSPFGEPIDVGVIDYWENEVDGLKFKSLAEWISNAMGNEGNEIKGTTLTKYYPTCHGFLNRRMVQWRRIRRNRLLS